MAASRRSTTGPSSRAGDPSVDRTAERRTEYQLTGAIASVAYPFTFYQRAELGVGYLYRKQSLPFLNPPGWAPSTSRSFSRRLPGDPGSPGGRLRRLRQLRRGLRAPLAAEPPYAPDLDDERHDSTRADELRLPAVLPVTDRSNIALRAFAGDSTGNRPMPYYFGGLDTVRGASFRSLVGDRAFFTNLEYRFPLVDLSPPRSSPSRGSAAWSSSTWAAPTSRTCRVQVLQLGRRPAPGRHRRLWLGNHRPSARPRLQLGLRPARWDLKQSGNFQTYFWIGTRF